MGCWSSTVVNKMYRGFTHYLQPMVGYAVLYQKTTAPLYIFPFVTHWSPFYSVPVEPNSSVGCPIVEVSSFHSIRHTTLSWTPLN